VAKNKTASVEAANREARIRLADALEGKGAHLTYEEAVRGFPERLMNEKPAHVPYSFWHQLEHIRITQWDMLRYIKDPAHKSPPWPEGYWPDQEAATDAAGWKRSIDGYLADRQELLDLLKDPETDLLAPVAHMENRSILRSVFIVVDHTAYHLGEFIMGRQILGAWKSELDRG
jgi:hypothetical protein